MRVSTPSFKLASLAVLTVLAACGGGGDSSAPAVGPTATGNQGNTVKPADGNTSIAGNNAAAGTSTTPSVPGNATGDKTGNTAASGTGNTPANGSTSGSSANGNTGSSTPTTSAGNGAGNTTSNGAGNTNGGNAGNGNAGNTRPAAGDTTGNGAGTAPANGGTVATPVVPPVTPPAKPVTPEVPTANNGTTQPPAAADAGNATKTPAAQSEYKTKGVWSTTVNWPLVAIHAALTADGRVLTYGTDYTKNPGSRFSYDVWDPTLGTGDDAHMMLPSQTDTFLFCSAQILLQDGRMLILGGDLLKDGRATNKGNKDVNLFDPVSGTLSLDRNKMTLPRWYGTATTLPTGEVYIQGGTDGERHPELRKADGAFRALDINTEAQYKLPNGQTGNMFENNYPRNFVAPNGKIFGFDPHFMYEIDPYGNNGKGSVKMHGAHWDFPRIREDGTEDWEYWRAWQATSTAAMVRPGLIFQFGGVNPSAQQAPVTLIDINGDKPKLIDLPPLTKPYVWSNATIMADGNVLVSGGSTENLLNDVEEPINQEAGEINYESLIFNPDTRKFSPGARFNERRLYHSVTLLLPDATILSSGGGQPGPVDNLNAQIYYPPYLFNADGTRAKRPVLQGEGDVAMVAEPASTIHIPTADAADISRVTLIKTGAVTHSFDMDQRYSEVKFRVNGNGLDIELPANKFQTPPGFYHVFAFNKAGVPSKSRMIRINPSVVAPK